MRFTAMFGFRGFSQCLVNVQHAELCSDRSSPLTMCQNVEIYPAMKKKKNTLTQRGSDKRDSSHMHVFAIILLWKFCCSSFTFFAILQHKKPRKIRVWNHWHFVIIVLICYSFIRFTPTKLIFRPNLTPTPVNKEHALWGELTFIELHSIYRLK